MDENIIGEMSTILPNSEVSHYQTGNGKHDVIIDGCTSYQTEKMRNTLLKAINVYITNMIKKEFQNVLPGLEEILCQLSMSSVSSVFSAYQFCYS